MPPFLQELGDPSKSRIRWRVSQAEQSLHTKAVRKPQRFVSLPLGIERTGESAAFVISATALRGQGQFCKGSFKGAEGFDGELLR